MSKKIAVILSLAMAMMLFTACDLIGGSGGSSSESHKSDNSSNRRSLSEQEISEGMREAELITEVEDEELEKYGSSLAERLPLLTQDGWKEKKGAYIYTTSDSECKGEYTITAKLNVAELTVDFDYFKDNDSMIEFYKDDTEAAKAICAYWYLRPVAVLDAPMGSVHYTLIVGDSEITKGVMTYNEASDAYDAYFMD